MKTTTKFVVGTLHRDLQLWQCHCLSFTDFLQTCRSTMALNCNSWQKRPYNHGYPNYHWGICKVLLLLLFPGVTVQIFSLVLHLTYATQAGDNTVWFHQGHKGHSPVVEPVNGQRTKQYDKSVENTFFFTSQNLPCVWCLLLKSISVFIKQLGIGPIPFTFLFILLIFNSIFLFPLT